MQITMRESEDCGRLRRWTEEGEGVLGDTWNTDLRALIVSHV